MQHGIEPKPKIQVNMLGEFSITVNGKKLTYLKGRTKRVWMLIEYLLANRKKDVSLDMLEKVLWEEDECGDPQNALKNLVYRARKLLKKISSDDNLEFFTFVRNTYSWNNEYDCIIDTEQLVNCWKLVNDSSNTDEIRIQACKRALDLYRGEFLPKSSYSTWVISERAYFDTLYNDCVINGCRVLTENRQLDEAIHICETALIYTPLEESIHKMLLYAYISNNQQNKALDHYNDTIKLFRKELGMDLSETLHPIYKLLISKTGRVEVDINIIENDLKESAAIRGAYYCDYDVFKSVYRIQARIIMRTGAPAFIVLFTLSDLNGEIPEPDVVKPAMDSLKKAILCSLRKGDTVASYSVTQFIMMLPLINYDNTKMVANRILQKFQSLYRENNVKMTTRITVLDAAR